MKVVLLFFALAGCRTQPLARPIDDTPILTVDLGVAVDLARPRDLSGGRIGCRDIIQCLNDCQSERCQEECFRRGNQNAQDAYQAALECLYNWCFDSQPGRPARCVQAGNGEPRDPPDMGFGGCQRCLENAFAEISGLMCDPNSIDCRPQGCEFEVQACLND